MKRSEMINIMYETYRNYQGPGDKHQFEILLTVIEEYMIPVDRSPCNCEDCGGPNHSWSEEDEKI